MRAVGTRAIRIQRKRMAAQVKTLAPRDLLLPFLNLGVKEFLDATALHANQVVVVSALVKFEHRLPRLKVLPGEQAGLFELRKHPVHSREAHVHAFLHQLLVDILRREMPHPAVLKQLQYAASRQR